LSWFVDVQIGRVGRQHVDVGCTPGGWFKKGTVDVQLWSGGGIARKHDIVLPGLISGIAREKSHLYHTCTHDVHLLSMIMLSILS
jgi:hypothetical protein